MDKKEEDFSIRLRLINERRAVTHARDLKNKAASQQLYDDVEAWLAKGNKVTELDSSDNSGNFHSFNNAEYGRNNTKGKKDAKKSK